MLLEVVEHLVQRQILVSLIQRPPIVADLAGTVPVPVTFTGTWTRPRASTTAIAIAVTASISISVPITAAAATIPTARVATTAIPIAAAGIATT
ncbi:hypothetical protein I5U42_04800 [Stenotrophomonas maltophilia]|nr:hypothetical protein [Stenotrophomonas maltophilia]